MRIVIGGDLVPTKSNLDLFQEGNAIRLLGSELFTIWNSADIRIFNLETPLVDNLSPIDKNGPCLHAPTRTINGIKALNPSLVTLANNHIMDQGVEGLKKTTQLLVDQGIPYFGAGNNLCEAQKPFILEYNGKKVGIYACTEHEFSIATAKTPGANPFDPLESLDHISVLKAECSVVIVLYHGGKEHYRYPSPYLKKVCRKIVEKGADIVVCQHSHCIGCLEQYLEGTIIYGQGNFIFNKYSNEFWQTSLLISIDVGEVLDVCYIPIMRTADGVCLALENDASDILEAFHKRSSEILQDGFIENQYESFAKLHFPNYVRSFAGFRKWISRIDNKIFKGMLSSNIYSKNQMLKILNFTECEAHRELFIKGIKERFKRY